MQMKKSSAQVIIGVILFLVLLVLNFLPKEKPKTDEDIFREGYWEGYHTAEHDLEKQRFDRDDEVYAEGYRQAVEDIRSAISDEVWSAYDAAMEIGTVHGFVSNPENDPLPTNEEYMDYVEELYLFWDFFEQHRYERYLEYN